ncbi:hypothetical protein NXT3_CH01719 [Sinorhizobium fredii]|uniref:Uncharacterized protein n=2 Tax=Rhizobium fredii TaxID=380 RepID=A0A2L0H467_RHIFR|nr:hypothetical protein NXT3_CH01719 [Sinorhizobium fredii]
MHNHRTAIVTDVADVAGGSAATSSRERQRRYRERRKAGRRMIQVEVNEVELAAALERLHFLDPLKADDDEAVQQAFDEMVRVLCRALADDDV